jgi:nitroimidazol reductase NimA-like FMN-containing flavoprotein (pyridoxamine 5'-phosphate oxidase superfamily)
MSKTTATAKNAMSAPERDAFLARPNTVRISTQRPDGYAHVTPVRYLWDEGKLVFNLVEGRKHLKNLRLLPKATACIDEDARLTDGPSAGAQGVMLAGTVTLHGPFNLEDDPHELRQFLRIAAKYRGPQDPNAPLSVEELRDLVPRERWSEYRTVVTLEPEILLTWDFLKG